MVRSMQRLRVEATIASLAPGGDGVAHFEAGGERRALFVPFTVPGDVVRAEVDPSRRPARGRVLELVRPGPGRVEPACAWFARCGGCDWMHLGHDAQAEAHAELLRAALPVAWRDLAVPVHVERDPGALRSRARVHVRCERGRVDVGMHEVGTHDPVSVDVCCILEPAIEGARRDLASLFASSRGRGDVQIALGVSGHPVLEVRWTGDVAPACFGRLETAVTSGALAGARVWIGEASRPAVVGDPTPWTTAGDGAPLRLAPGGFGQASASTNAKLVRYVAGEAGPPEATKAVELYAGAGNLSVLLARGARDLVLVESSREACDAARANLAARLLEARVIEADAAAYVWPTGTRLVVLDPPRTGAREVCTRLAASRVARVVYVSCDTQTLARDLAILAPAYVPRSVAAFEMFPETSHVEAVVVLDRAPRGRA
jgi:23S rRNA (uracil1939-C5)-methyltransferase